MSKTRLREQKSKRSRTPKWQLGARRAPERSRAAREGPAHSTTLARSNRLRQPLDAPPPRSGHLGPPKFGPARPRPLLRVRAPAPERARGAGPRGLGGRELGTRREGRAAAGPALRELGSLPVPPSGHFPFTPARLARRAVRLGLLAAAAARRRGEAPRRAPAARPTGARGRARPRAGAALPPARPHPQRAAAARWRLSLRARCPSAPGGFSLAKLRGRVERGTARSPAPAPPPPLQAAAREGPAGSPAFLPAGSFRARAPQSLAFPSLALVFFLSFLLFAPLHGRFFRSRRPRSPARALLPAGLGGAGRQAALPAPLHPRSGGGGGGAPRSDSFQYGTGSGRMRPRPPPSALLPAARAPRAARVAPPSPASPTRPRAGPPSWGLAGCEASAD